MEVICFRQLFHFSVILLLFSKTEEEGFQHSSLHVQATDVVLAVLHLFEVGVIVCC